MNKTLIENAIEVEELLPAIMRRLFTVDPNHPVMEMPLGQLRVCVLLQSGPRSMSALGEELGISVSAVTQLADRLERAGLVARVAGDDRRTKALALTECGEEIMRSRREIRVRRAADALAYMSERDREAVIRALRTLLNAGAATAPHIRGEDPVAARVQL